MKHEMPVMTEQEKADVIAFAEFCKGDKENPSSLHFVCQIALACLNSKPVGYVSDISREIADDGRLGYISNHMVAGLEGGYVYDAPPVPVIPAPAVSLAELVPTVCDGKEQEAFEEYARSKGLNLSQHPLHYLFLDGKTNQARSAWRECLVYVRNAILREIEEEK